METEPLVSIKCLTYNHEPYIRQCLEGFVMQKTNFKFEAIVHDDASTDKTADVIKEYAEKYPDIIKPIYEIENQYSKHDGSLNRIMNAHLRGKYIAMCEGDDYWIDPLKLQKQVLFLERHQEYGMYYTKCRFYFEKSKHFSKKAWGGDRVTFDQLIIENTIPTLTVLYRKNPYLRYEKEKHSIGKNWKMGDYPFWLWLSHNSVIYFSKEITGVYRVLQESASHNTKVESQEDFVFSTYSIIKYFTEFFRCKNLYNDQRLYKSLYNNAVKFGDFAREKSYYQMICSPSFVQRVKHLICKKRSFYNLLSRFIIHKNV